MITSRLYVVRIFRVNAAKVSCFNLVVQVIEFDALKKTKQQESYLGYGLTE